MSSVEESMEITTEEEASLLPLNRFELELEFVQCLASPAYLHYLATMGVLQDAKFLEFLQYLQYWKQHEYARFLQYPHCLYFMDLLSNNALFRRELSNVAFRNFCHEQQFYSWQYRATTLYGHGLENNTTNSSNHNVAENSQEQEQQQQENQSNSLR